MSRIDEVLIYARDTKCSDVHISVGEGIVLRRTGTLMPYHEQFSDDMLEEMINSIMNPRQIEKLNKGLDADFTYSIGKNRHRVNVYRQLGKLTAALRIINDEVLTLEQLNLPPVLNKIADAPRGLVLITGPTGSGKSTTLAAMIDYVNTNKKCHILTIEDPVEYVYEKKLATIHQREIENDVESFDIALKSAMREDPDVVLVGEMRDYETISAVITLAETGHLVFSTLHTIGAANTIDRVIDVFPPEKQEQIRVQLGSVLNAVVTQQLIPTADGNGRVAALEVMIATDAIKNLIRESKVHQINSSIQTGRDLGMVTLNSALASLYKSGKISHQMALAYSSDKEDLKNYLI